VLYTADICDGVPDLPRGMVRYLRVIQMDARTYTTWTRDGRFQGPCVSLIQDDGVKRILGTVPVEEDGSAYFTVPAQREVYFQALDEDGLAVQSMRSVTYVHPGEKLTCQGCHELKHRPPNVPTRTPLAMRRPPSKIEPDVSGSNPFNYPRLVQGVLDRNCVECHREKKALDLTGDIGKGGFTTSYNNLARKYGFYFNVRNGSINDGVHGGARTTPGQFGARASKLYDLLKEGHYDVKLSEEEMHRITVWLDSCSIFYGVYEAEGGLAQLEGKVAYPTLE